MKMKRYSSRNAEFFHHRGTEVKEVEPNREMVWQSGMPLGLFSGERRYTLTPRDGGTTFAMREAFTGLLSPLIDRTIPDLQPAFEEFAACLQRRAEAPRA